jgi:phosphoserine aminotransferase
MSDKLNRVFNFNPGPSTLPLEVMQEAQREFVDYHGTGLGIAESSHRGAEFKQVLAETEADIRELLGISNDYAVLFLQGGASLQFAMAPMNLALEDKPMLYADTGSWTSKAIKEAKLFGQVKTVFDGKGKDYTTIAPVSEWNYMSSDASYLYVCSNNTIAGTQYAEFPELEGVPLIADMSSDIMSRQLDIDKFGMIFAGAQKNLGPAGVTLVIIRRDLAERVSSTVPTMLKYTTHIEKGSTFNTPPSFAIYMVGLVVKWIKKLGGLAAMEELNNRKADILYDAIDAGDFYRGTAAVDSRSKMNVTFRLPSEELEAEFIKNAGERGMIGLKGHRSVGGIRASIYNAMPAAGVEALTQFMREFAADKA